MRSLRINQIEDRESYRIDLVQHRDGLRHIYVRREDDEPHEFTAISTIALTGVVIRQFLMKGNENGDVKTECGHTFVLDGHNSWLLAEEALYWKECRSAGIEDWSDGPWVNGKMPIQYAR